MTWYECSSIKIVRLVTIGTEVIDSCRAVETKTLFSREITNNVLELLGLCSEVWGKLRRHQKPLPKVENKSEKFSKWSDWKAVVKNRSVKIAMVENAGVEKNGTKIPHPQIERSRRNLRKKT